MYKSNILSFDHGKRVCDNNDKIICHRLTSAYYIYIQNRYYIYFLVNHYAHNNNTIDLIIKLKYLSSCNIIKRFMLFRLFKMWTSGNNFLLHLYKVIRTFPLNFIGSLVLLSVNQPGHIRLYTDISFLNIYFIKIFYLRLRNMKPHEVWSSKRVLHSSRSRSGSVITNLFSSLLISSQHWLVGKKE